MVTLSSCLIWEIISFILPPNEYGCVHAWITLGSGLAIDVQKMPITDNVIVIGPCRRNFGSPKLKRRILATFGFNRTATQPKLHSVFWALFLKIALSELIYFVHLAAAIWHRWSIICGVPSKISVTPTSQRQLTLKGQYSWSHWWNTKIRSVV